MLTVLDKPSTRHPQILDPLLTAVLFWPLGPLQHHTLMYTLVIMPVDTRQASYDHKKQLCHKIHTAPHPQLQRCNARWQVAAIRHDNTVSTYQLVLLPDTQAVKAITNSVPNHSHSPQHMTSPRYATLQVQIRYSHAALTLHRRFR